MKFIGTHPLFGIEIFVGLYFQMPVENSWNNNILHFQIEMQVVEYYSFHGDDIVLAA